MKSNSAYQRDYYQKHIQDLREKAKLRERMKRAMAQAFETKKNAPKKSELTSKARVSIETIAIPPLLCFTTILLLKEMAAFYSEPNGTFWMPWITAIVMEGLALFFSFAWHSNSFTRIFYKALAISLVVASTYAMTAKHFSNGLGLFRTDQMTEREIVDLETAIKEKRIQRDNFSAKGWITAARKMEHQIDTLRESLEALRHRIIQAKPALAVASTALSWIFLRVLLSVCNIFLVHHFGKNLSIIESWRTDSRNILEIPGRVLKFQQSKRAKGKRASDFQNSRLKNFESVLKFWGRKVETS